MNKRQKKKHATMENRKLAKKYPFIIPRDKYDKIPQSFDFKYTLLDDMPIGWKKAFGKLMCEDIKKELAQNGWVNSYHVFEVKEKFGSLRWYDNCSSEVLRQIMYDYEHISHRTCVCCGKVGVKVYNTGWVSPYCDKCFKNFYEKQYKNKNLEDFVVEDEPFNPKYKVNIYIKDETITKEYDVTPILKRMKKKYYNHK